MNSGHSSLENDSGGRNPSTIIADVTLNHLSHSAERRLDSLGIEPDPWNRGDRLGGHAISIVQPEDGPVSDQDRARVKGA